MFTTQQYLALTDAMGPLLAIDPSRLPHIAALATGEPQAAYGERTSQASSSNKVAVIDVQGPITHKPTWWSISTMEISAMLDKALKSSAPAIIVSWDSPGGTIPGVAELSNKIYHARSVKPIISVVSSLAASAAYWIASAATEVVAAPHSDLGSVGVFALHQDVSEALKKEGVNVSLIHAGKYKVEGNPFQPLGDEGRAEMQRRCDAFHNDFVRAVARNRNVSESLVRNGFGQGRLVQAEHSLINRMADRIATLEQTLGRFAVGTSRTAMDSRIAQLAAWDREDRLRQMGLPSRN